MRFLKFLFIISFLPLAANAEEHFQSPTTDLEIKLDKILVSAEDDFKINNKEANNNLGLTDDLVHSIYDADSSARLMNCNGGPIAGETCGLGYSPVICAKNGPEKYYYLTEIENSANAVIKVADSEYGDMANVYRMINENGEWKVESVQCSNGDKFN